jgi:hypothetical protein
MDVDSSGLEPLLKRALGKVERAFVERSRRDIDEVRRTASDRG